MMRKVLSIVVGLVAWVVVASIGDRLLRAGWSDYAVAEPTMTFSLGMLAARLLLGAFSTAIGGVVVATLSNGDRQTVLVAGVVTLGLFCINHYFLWNRLPIWYHLTWLGSIVPVMYLGAMLRAKRSASRTAAKLG
jgi:hypothetical protein